MIFNEDAKQLLSDYTDFISRNVDVSTINNTDYDISQIIHYNDLNAVKQRISNWVSARLTARHAYVPDWTDLIRVYDYVVIDSHVTGIINGIKQKIKAKEWSVKKSNGEIDEDLTRQLKTRWFSRYQDFFVEAMFFPYSLVELGEYKDSRFDDIRMIKREYVVPQWKSVKLYLGGSAVPSYNHHFALTGTMLGQPRQEPGNYLLEYFESEDRINDYIFMQNPIHDLGLLDMASPHALGKMGSYTFFLDYLQKFVIPFRLGKTELNDNPRRNNMVAMMENWGASGYAVTDLLDEVELLSQSGSATAPFTDLFTYSNNEISKAFASAVGIFDEKNFVGSAEAGERMLDYIVQSYCTEMEYNINDELIPRLVQRDGKYKGKEFDFISKEVIPYRERVDAIIKLATEFNLDPEEVGEMVDMTIVPDPSLDPDNEMNGIDKIKQESQSRLKGTVGGVQGILAIQQQVGQGVTQYEAGVEILIEIFGFDDAQARKILGNPGEFKETQASPEEVKKLEKEVSENKDMEDEENEPQALYPDEMVANVNRALKYVAIKNIDIYADKWELSRYVADCIINNIPMDEGDIVYLANLPITNKEPYTKSDNAIEVDLYGGEEGIEWAINQLRDK